MFEHDSEELTAIYEEREQQRLVASYDTLRYLTDTLTYKLLPSERDNVANALNEYENLVGDSIPISDLLEAMKRNGY